jgi:hypothetical protein
MPRRLLVVITAEVADGALVVWCAALGVITPRCSKRARHPPCVTKRELHRNPLFLGGGEADHPLAPIRVTLNNWGPTMIRSSAFRRDRG